MVKFQTQLLFNLQVNPQGVATLAFPLNFVPTQLPGFLEWQATMSEFRILKAHVKVNVDPNAGQPQTAAQRNQQYTFLRVPSRQFVATRAILGSADNGVQNQPQDNILTGVTVDQVRQSKWTKQVYPKDDTNIIQFGFYPYTLQWSGKPYNGAFQAAANQTQYLEYRSGRRWMSMSFLGPTEQKEDDVSFFGPYVLRLLSSDSDAQALSTWSTACLLTVWCQFRGQR